MALFLRPTLSWSVAAASIGITAVLLFFTSQTMMRSARHQFEYRSIGIAEQIEARLLLYESLLRGGVAFFAGSNEVSRDEWRTYVETLRIGDHWPGIQGMGYCIPVISQGKEEHIRKIREEGSAEYTIKPLGTRAIYAPTIYLEPLNWRNQRAIGYDMYSEPTRRKAVERARDTGDGSISGKVTLVQETDEDIQPGFLMYFPFYRSVDGEQPTTLEERRMALKGWVYAPFRVRDFMKGILGPEGSSIGFDIFDGPVMSEDRLLFRAPDVERSGSKNPKHDHVLTKQLIFKDHEWTIHFVAPKGTLVPELKREFKFLIGMAFIINALIFYVVHSIQGLNRRANRIAFDMTKELKVRTEELEKSRRALSLIQDALNRTAIVAMTDAKGRITYVNDRFCEVSKYSHEEALGEDHRIINSGLHSKEFWKDFWSTIQNGKIWRGEIRNRAKDGSLYWVDTAIVPVIGENGRPEQFLAFRFLITDRKEAEEALRKLNYLQQSILNNAGSSMIATTPQGVITLFNPAAEEMLGYTAEEMIGRMTPEVFHDKDEVARRAVEFGEELGQKIDSGFEVFAAKARKDLPNTCEWTYIRKDGTRLPVLLSVAALRDNNDTIFGFLGIATDMTERKQMEEKIAEAVAVKGEFISMVSHELRTPLTVIKEGIGLVADGTLGTLNADQSDYLNLAQRNTDRLARLINDVLDYQKLDAGQMEMRTAQHDLNGVIRENLPTFASLAAQRGLMIKTDLAQEILPLQFDKDKIIQVLMNFVGNAIKFTERGHVTIRTTHEGNAVHVAVVDNGIGIKEEDQHKLFTSFSQIHDSGIHKTGGTGLGLAISKKIIEMHRGRIGVASVWGHGATFYFTLPIVERRK